MLRMPAFQVHSPTTAADAVRLRSELPSAMYVAGGTDLLPNLKHQLHQPEHLVSLLEIPELRGIHLDADGTLTIGSGTTLFEVETSPVVMAAIPGLSQAAGSVAAPQHRRMGTMGGNILLDTRCLFYNQSEEWRHALGYCLKRDGDWCHVMGTPKACVAAQSSDTVPILTALGASILWTSPDGAGATRLADLFGKDGRFDDVHQIPHTSLVTGIRVPPRAAGHQSAHRKVRARQAVDYAQLSIGIVASVSGNILESLDIVVGALLPQPKIVALDGVAGQPLGPELAAAVAERVYKQVKPQTNIHGSPEWRRHMARIEVRRAIEALAPQA